MIDYFYVVNTENTKKLLLENKFKNKRNHIFRLNSRTIYVNMKHVEYMEINSVESLYDDICINEEQFNNLLKEYRGKLSINKLNLL